MAVIDFCSETQIPMRIRYRNGSVLTRLPALTMRPSTPYRVGNWLAFLASGDAYGISRSRILFVALALVQVDCLLPDAAASLRLLGRCHCFGLMFAWAYG